MCLSPSHFQRPFKKLLVSPSSPPPAEDFLLVPKLYGTRNLMEAQSVLRHPRLTPFYIHCVPVHVPSPVSCSSFSPSNHGWFFLLQGPRFFFSIHLPAIWLPSDFKGGCINTPPNLRCTPSFAVVVGSPPPPPFHPTAVVPIFNFFTILQNVRSVNSLFFCPRGALPSFSLTR